MRTIESATRPSGLAFEPAEYQTRLTRVRALMARDDLSALVLHLPDNICYLSGLDLGHSGYFAYHALVVPLDGDPVLIYREMEGPAVAATSWTPRLAYSDEDAQPIDATRQVLHELGLDTGRIGIDQHAWTMTAERFQVLQTLLPAADIIAESRITEQVRLVKSAAEISYLRRAARAASAGIRAAVDHVHDGVNELELAAAIAGAQARAGSEDLLVGVVGSGERAEWLHSAWSDRVIRTGEIVKFELHGVVRHYWGRQMRTAVVGEPTPEQRRIAEVLRAAQDDGISRIAPGVSAGEIDAACRLPVERANILTPYQNRIGYGLGLHFRPMAGDFSREFMRGVDWVLEPGMVFHMLTQAHGIGFSETVLVTDDGHEVLTDAARELAVR